MSQAYRNRMRQFQGGPHINGAAPSEPFRVDPHAPIALPKWAHVQIVAEPGTKFLIAADNGGFLKLIVRSPIMVRWPVPIPPEVKLVPGANYIELAMGQNMLNLQAPAGQAADHAFEPSLLDPSKCKICAVEPVERWLLTWAGEENTVETMKTEAFPADELGFSLAQKRRRELVEDPAIHHISLNRGKVRDV